MNSIGYAAALILLLTGAWYFLARDSANVVTMLPPSASSSMRAEIALHPEKPVAGESTTFTLSFVDESGRPITDLMEHHARRVHVLLIGEDLETIGHVHPEDFTDVTDQVVASGVYSVDYTFPEAGRYIVAVDVMNQKDTLSQQFIVTVDGEPAMSSMSVTADTNLTKCFVGNPEERTDRYVDAVHVSDAEVACPDGYVVTLIPSSLPIVAGKETLLRYNFEKDGAPVTNLQPYLSAAMHYAIVPTSFETVLHRHGSVDETVEESGVMTDHDDAMMHTESAMVMDDKGKSMEHDHDTEESIESMEMEGMTHEHAIPGAFGPNVISEPIIFPHVGTYRIFGQVKHDNQIIVTAFTVEVQEEEGSAMKGEQKHFALEIKNRQLTGETTLSVEEGDSVILMITSDEDEELHVHGYDKSVELQAGKSATLTFEAVATGRFPFELEQSGTDLGALEVHPR